MTTLDRRNAAEILDDLIEESGGTIATWRLHRAIDALETSVATTLDGATDAGPENAYPSDPGEFAARWNAQHEDGRRAFLTKLINASERSMRCFQMNHDGLQQEVGALSNVLGRISGYCDALEAASDDVLAGVAIELRSILRNEESDPE